MKPTDPTPEEYVKWIIHKLVIELELEIYTDAYIRNRVHPIAKFILTELRDNSTTEINRLYFNECLIELKKL